MLAYAKHRIAYTVPILIGVMFLAFVLINAMPGDPISMMLNPNALDLSSAAAQQARRALGLDQPLLVRFIEWLGQAVQGNLGYSASTGDPVLQIVLARFANTLELVAPALLLSLILAFVLGTLAATHRGGWVDYLLSGLGVASVSVPSFFLGLGGIYIFALRLHLLPAAGKSTLGAAPSASGFLAHLLMPALVIALLSAGELVRYVRASLLDVLGMQYLRTARAKGLSEARVILRHAMRNALLPVVTALGTRVPQMLGGAVITETIFQWPGAGMLSVQAVANRDYPVLMGVLLVSAIIVLLTNLVTDLLYARLDPRIRLGGSAV